jgi:hypothetical protein
MARKILVPVLPSDRFYDAVVAAAGQLTTDGGGLIVFLFTDVPAPPLAYEKDASGRADLEKIEEELDDDVDVDALDSWREQAVQGLDEARQLLRDRGVPESNVDYAFADYAVPRAEAIAEEAAAGGYDAVILPAGFIVTADEEIEEQPPAEIAEALREMGDVRVLVV